MAGAGRIRHKLVLGLGLVVGIMAVLLAGSVKGLRSYTGTLKSVASKLAELGKAHELESAVGELESPISNLWQEGQMETLLRGIGRAEGSLEAYEKQLDDTLQHRRDPSKGFNELPLVADLRNSFQKLKEARKAVKEAATSQGRSSNALMKEELHLAAAVKDLRGRAALLRETLQDELNDRLRDGRRYYGNSMIFVGVTGAVGFVLLVSLARFTYRWIVHPVRELDSGVRRVAQGDFDHQIEVRSGDEMEELAAAFNDMTGRLRAMYSDLARQVNERSKQLVRSERLASVGFLAAGVAHEINNPLASIAFCSEALESRLADALKLVKDPADAAVVSKYLRMIQQEAFRCKEITQRLLEFSRGGERRREPTNLSDLVQGVLDMVQHLQNGKGKRIIFEPALRPTAWVNAQEMKQVVLNLVVNALDSMDEGGTLTISLTLDAGRRTAPSGRVAELVFADTGCGMTEEVLENIFEPFFTRSRTGKGTGLGLSISHRIVNQHGGEIEAASRGPGLGSTFTVRVPLQPAEAVKEETLGRAAA